MNGRLILVRHAEVAQRYKGVCYGQSDVELSPAGEQHSLELANQLSQSSIDRLVHSGLVRTQFLADALGKRCSIEAEFCPALQERHYGSWELMPWDEIHRSFPDDMMRVVTQPQDFQPGGGETTFQLRDRVVDWYESLPHEQTIVAITHGGPIAALLGTLDNHPVSKWPGLIPPFGQMTTIKLHH